VSAAAAGVPHVVVSAADPAPAPRARSLLALARYELAADARGRTLPAFTAGFALAALAIALSGLSAGGSLAVQGFGRTSISLLQLTIWVVPLVALTTAAMAAADGYEMELLAAQPVSRGTLVVGRALGRFLGLALALCVGYGLAGLIIAAGAGVGDAWRFLGLVGVALLLAAVSTALGTLGGVLARTRARALTAAFALWFACTIGLDLLAIALLAALPRAELTRALAALLLLNPVGAARTLGVALFAVDAVAGPLGAALRRVLGPAGGAVLVAGLLAWTAVPIAAAARAFSRRDL
jgi:ABC-type transport system involved in multi-copper enzyme maturation permease subunit